MSMRAVRPGTANLTISGTFIGKFRTNGSLGRITHIPFMRLDKPASSEVEWLGTKGSAAGPDAPPTGQAGFSLIEALVALVILAIATVGLIRTVETHIDSTRSLEGRQAAMWVAENRLAELEAGIDGSDRADMLGRAWRIAVAERATGDPAIRRVRIDVYETPARPGASPLASLDGFVDAERS